MDLTRPDAIEAAMRVFERTLDEAEKLLVGQGRRPGRKSDAGGTFSPGRS